jgi:dihydropyrimidinase
LVPGFCSPPVRQPSDQEALWQALALGDLQTVSSDHAPYRFDANGKSINGADPDFEASRTACRAEARLPLLFDAMVSRAARLGEVRVALGDRARKNLRTAFPQGRDRDRRRCRHRNLGSKAQVTIGAALAHDLTGYSPYEGRVVTGWPVT